jgi:RNA polymerase sigma-70 factor (ECF subfamily)
MSIDPLENPQPLIERVYSYVAYRVGDGVHAEDITSETFERALRYRKRYDERRGSPISWLIGIARRVIADHVAGQHAHAAEVPELAADGAFEEQVASRLELRAAVRELPERDQELIALRFGADLTAKQIARVLGLRTNTVEVSLHRALMAMRRALEHEQRATDAGAALHRVL